MARSNHIKAPAATGEDTFFIAIVEDLNDPLQLGRVKVRIINQNDTDTPTAVDDLPWCTVGLPLTSASLNGVGTSPTWIEVGSYVMGTYLDKKTKRQPFLQFTFNKIPENDINKHDVSKLARGENIVTKEPIGPEPESAFAAKYPHNKVITTPSGHVIEIDDTPEAERIHVFHKSGTYFEIDHTGRMVRKVVGDDYQLVANNSEIHVEGKINVYIKGNATLKVDGDYTAEVAGTYTVKSGGNMKFEAPKIDLNE